MRVVNKINGYMLFFIVTIAITFLNPKAFLNQARAYSIGSTSNVNDAGQAVGRNLSSPITDFINSAKQINLSLPPKTGFNIGSFSPTSILNQANDWFYRETGFRFSDIFKKVGALLVYLLTAMADGVKWLISWL